MSYRISWRDIFDSSHKLWKDFDACLKYVKDTGYRFFTFNGKVYHINGSGYVEETEWTVNDIG